MNRKNSKFQDINPLIPPVYEECSISLPSGKSIKLPILTGTDGTSFIDIRNLHALSGLFTFDSGFSCTASCISGITHIDGDKGKLIHRGY
jgi:hypothetical protein